ncbi:MAG: DUF4845 domain-containing protein [Gallionellales bacterium CG03_land_8_20_14_0_80_55_15]|nr:MAG: DUF4845 domain-containing protein [Gallionellales bacterium CG03_land_8_20_14_0_80_55_15]
MPIRQRGLSFSGFIFGAFVLVLLSITGLKMIPVYMQNATINKLFLAIAQDPDMQKASPREIRNSFDKRASIDDVTVITSQDIDVESDAGTPVLSANYSVKVPLVANISLYLEFNPRSAGK